MINYPFLDGNKRTGYVMMHLLLLQSGQDIQAEQEEKYRFVISIATGKLTFNEIRKWIAGKLQK